jgi:predicted RNase H-like HicB family nuclease
MKNYAINIFYSAEDKGFIANIPELQYCSAIGNTELEALQELLLARAAWFEVAELEAKSISPVSLEPDVKAVPQSRTNLRTGRSSNKPRSTLAVRQMYQGYTLLEAIAKILKQLEGQKVDGDMVVKELYGELSPDLFRIAKERVIKNLSKGKIERMWDRVPEQVGFYTSSLTKIRN